MRKKSASDAHCQTPHIPLIHPRHKQSNPLDISGGPFGVYGVPVGIGLVFSALGEQASQISIEDGFIWCDMLHYKDTRTTVVAVGVWFSW